MTFFEQNGYVILRDVIAPDELEDLQRESMAQIDAGPDREPAGHFKCAPNPDGEPIFFRIESTLTKVIHNESTLRTMAHPKIIEAVSSIIPDGFVCWADALLWKGTSGGVGVGPHSAHQFGADFNYENLVVDVYLDESNADVGCLKVLPGTHKLSPAENLALLAQGWDAPGFVDVEMRPGDVLLHSEWMIHGSLPAGPLPQVSRRILYFAMMDPRARPDERRTTAMHIRRMQVAQQRRGDSPLNVVPPGWDADVAAISEDEALTFDAAAC